VGAYIAIDLKSFFASAECAARGLDPLKTNLVVADITRTEKTICLAVSPSLKSYGIPGRARLFEVVQRVKGVNAQRSRAAKITGKSYDDDELKAHPEYAVDYIIAPPRMSLYMKTSSEIYNIYLKYVAPEDIIVYSIDEVFIDVTKYLLMNGITPREMAMRIILDVLSQTGITATAGIGTNMYLAKIAMDVEAKHIPADSNGVRIAELDEMSYREKMWTHTPITDFWRVGRGTAKRLAAHYMYTMGDVALMSVTDEDLLYRLFGVNAELLIDHAWGWEPCTVEAIKAYRPERHSMSIGQVLHEPYDNAHAAIIVREMTETLSLEMVEKRVTAEKVALVINYDVSNMKNGYMGDVSTDYYGRRAPKPAHGSKKLPRRTSSARLMCECMLAIFSDKTDKNLLIRNVYVIADGILPEDTAPVEKYEQLDMFTDYAALDRQREEENARLERERKVQDVLVEIKNRYGKNAILKGTNFLEGATGRERNLQVGGHKSE